VCGAGAAAGCQATKGRGVNDGVQPPAELPPLDHRWRRRADGSFIWRENPDDPFCVGVGCQNARTAQEMDWWRAHYDAKGVTQAPAETRDEVALRMEL
jgi:hypothetical protein